MSLPLTINTSDKHSISPFALLVLPMASRARLEADLPPRVAVKPARGQPQEHLLAFNIPSMPPPSPSPPCGDRTHLSPPPLNPSLRFLTSILSVEAKPVWAERRRVLVFPGLRVRTSGSPGAALALSADGFTAGMGSGSAGESSSFHLTFYHRPSTYTTPPQPPPLQAPTPFYSSLFTPPFTSCSVCTSNPDGQPGVEAATESGPVHPPEHQRELFVGAPWGGGWGEEELGRAPSLQGKKDGDICSDELLYPYALALFFFYSR